MKKLMILCAAGVLAVGLGAATVQAAGSNVLKSCPANQTCVEQTQRDWCKDCTRNQDGVCTGGQCCGDNNNDGICDNTCPGNCQGNHAGDCTGGQNYENHQGHCAGGGHHGGHT